MTLHAVVFGSLGTLTETSDLHRRAFNQAFSELGLEWEWSEETYTDLLVHIGGANRILAFAKSHGDDSVTTTTATELHRYKTKLYADLVAEAPSTIRPGVHRLIRSVKEAGLKLGFATSTSRANIDASIASLDGLVTLDDFDSVITIDDLDRGKPAPDAHVVCMSRLGVGAGNTIAIEDTENSVASASIAGATIVATPGDYAVDQNFSSAAVTVTSLGDPDTQAFIVGDGPKLDDGMVTLDWLTRLSDVVS